MISRLLSLVLIVLVGLPLLTLEPAAAPPLQAPLIKRSSSAIAITPDGHTLLLVNPDSNSLSLVSSHDLSLQAEVTVGTDPRTVAIDDAGMRAYVGCRGTDSVTVVDLSSQEVVGEVAVGVRP